MILLRRDAVGLARRRGFSGLGRGNGTVGQETASEGAIALSARSYLALAVLLTISVGCRKTAPVSPAAPAASAEPPAAPPPRGRQLTLIYSSNLDGEYAPCPCVQPAGGVARRATLIGRAKAEADATLIIDAGDLFATAAAPAETARRARLLALTVGAELDAFSPGERDLAIGLPLLKAMATLAKFPIVSTNLYGRDGQRLFAGDRLIDRAGVRIGIFGVSAPPTAADANRWRAAGIEARDPVDAAREAVQSLRARGAALVIALVHVGLPAENRRLVAAVDGIDWAVLGHSALNLETPERAGSARLLEAMSEGKSLGRLDLHIVNGGLTFTDRGERGELEAILADHQRQLGGYDPSLSGIDPASLESYYQRRRELLRAAIGRDKALLARMPRTISGSWFGSRILLLDPSVPDDPKAAGLVRSWAPPHSGLAVGPRPHL
jgi:2',3'-cyclic-nucleotide 2'-phosphodiesterase (5'-nucleotidase family)